MHWDNPSFLLALWLLPAVAGLLAYAYRKRLATAHRFAQQAMLVRLMPRMDVRRAWIKGTALIVGLALLIVAAARPRFGAYVQEVAQRGADVFVLLDVSKSMTTEDVAPNRLERAKSDIRDLLGRITGDRVGLIAFAGKPVVKVPLTTDHGFFDLMLERIDTDSAPRGGSLIGDAVRKAIESMPERGDRDQAIVLITDGEDHDSFPEEAARQAGERGIKIFTVGLGDATEGARIPIRDESGQLHYMKYAGKEVWSKVDQDLLKKMALDTGGAYIPAGTRAYDLGQIYEDHLANLAHGEFHTETRTRYREQFQLFACLGLALLLIQTAVPEYQRT
ncbi:MAG: VWA domain-containing protein [Pirellulales bacterium]|nr:VWA domain-containing protein [Pirellulales bacterium]